MEAKKVVAMFGKSLALVIITLALASGCKKKNDNNGGGGGGGGGGGSSSGGYVQPPYGCDPNYDDNCDDYGNGNQDGYCDEHYPQQDPDCDDYNGGGSNNWIRRYTGQFQNANVKLDIDGSSSYSTLQYRGYSYYVYVRLAGQRGTRDAWLVGQGLQGMRMRYSQNFRRIRLQGQIVYCSKWKTNTYYGRRCSKWKTKELNEIVDRDSWGDDGYNNDPNDFDDYNNY